MGNRTEEFTRRFSNLILLGKHFGNDKAEGSFLMEVCMAYVTKYGYNVQVKRWLEEDGMRLKEYLPVHFSSFGIMGLRRLANVQGGYFWSVSIVS